MSIEAMKQALEAIANSGDFLFNWHDCEPNNEREMSRYQDVLAMNEKAFNTLRTSIEQAEKQEPVAWMVDVDIANYQGQSEYRTILAWNAKPVWSGTHEINEVLKAVPLYTTPPAAQRQWVGLTQQDIDIAFDDTQEGGGFNEFARAIEAKLREKNGF